ncbi:hypothetical protein PC128_g14642 [Phytophthora cactorum]|nr:hypothetical protein PC128_g14642 [Phytophthora cactorum]
MVDALEFELDFFVEDDDLAEVPPELLAAALPDPDVELELPSPVLDELDEPLLTTTPTITPMTASTTIAAMAISPFLGIAMLSCFFLFLFAAPFEVTLQIRE